VTVLWVLLGIAVLAGVAVVAAGRGEGLAAADTDRPDLTMPATRPMAKEDVDRLRFSVGLRGYRMDEVDDVLDRLAADLAERDQRIEALEGEIRGAGRHARPADGEPSSESRIESEPDSAEGPTARPPEADAPVTARTLIVPFEHLPEPPAHAQPTTDTGADAAAEAPADRPADSERDRG
jgi:DivIVA domain-containing protein